MLRAYNAPLVTSVIMDTVADSGYSSNAPTTKPSPDVAPTNTAVLTREEQLHRKSLLEVQGEAKCIEEDGIDFSEGDVENEEGEDAEYEAKLTPKTPRTSNTEDTPKPDTKRRFLVGLSLPTLVSPKSSYEGWSYKLPISKERLVLQEFHQNSLEEDTFATTETTTELSQHGRKRKQAIQENTFNSYRLDDFTVYHPASDKRIPLEMTCLHNLSVKPGKNVLLFDGVLSDGKTKKYVEGAPFTKLSIGNYGELSLHTVEGAIWIQSDAAKAADDAWYELGKPAEVYEKYHNPFLWLANFAKFFIDFLDRPSPKYVIEGDERPQVVTLRNFKEKFGAWINKLHGSDPQFRKWYSEYGRDDFRQVVSAHCPFLWNQAYNTDIDGRLVNHSLWDEVMRLAIIKQPKGTLVNETIVTPLVYDCFHHIFGNKLKAIAPHVPLIPMPPGKKLILDRVEVLSSPWVKKQSPCEGSLSREVSVFESRPRLNERRLVDVKPGDVVAVVKDANSVWKGKSEYWYAYVQSVNNNSQKRNSTSLDVIWLYLPEDTILGKMLYPYANELFFSDNCNCGDTKVRLDEVLFKIKVALFVGPEDEKVKGCGFFMRQKFSDTESNFTTLMESDLSCECRKPIVSAYEQAKKHYDVGDTVLVESYSVDDYAKDVLEPAQIVRFDEESQLVELRQLYRRTRDFADNPDARPNELVYTNHLVLVQPKFISRRCHIRFFSPAMKPTPPYDRDGTGDCFFIFHQITAAGDLVPIDPPSEFHQGFDPNTPPENINIPHLNGMDLFCGGGNFGRGIEEGGAVVNKWAVDLDVPALHTYRANLRDPNTKLYLGSVNNYLRDGLLGKFSSLIPPPGQVDFISAGSPCQGFSNANLDRDSEKSLGNSSLVASVASFVDFYRPKFALLENVHGLAQDRKRMDGLSYNVFSQLLCSLVAMGYQCQQFTLDAWSFGSCQTRTRLFVSTAAPGQRLPPRPGRSHEHPPTIRSKALFEAPNGKKFGGRDLHGPCTYPYVSSLERLGDLPNLGDNHPGICIPYPDHRHSRIEAANTRLLMTHIPKVRTCSSMRRAIDQGRVPPSLDFYNRSFQRTRDYARSWSRNFEDDLCRTITTTITPQCAFTGQWMHWDQHRLLTVMEVRRVQSFPDEEVLLGNAAKAFRIVGNSVDRAVALAWGLAMREAWQGRGPGEGNEREGVLEKVPWKREFEKRFRDYAHLREEWKELVPALQQVNDHGDKDFGNHDENFGDDSTIFGDACEFIEVGGGQVQEKLELAEATTATTAYSISRYTKELTNSREDTEEELRDQIANEVFVTRAIQRSTLCSKRDDPFIDLENTGTKDIEGVRRDVLVLDA